MVENRRKFSRLAVLWPVTLTFEGGDVIQGETKDVSLQGLFVFSALQRPVGHRCKILITPPGRTPTPIHAFAKIVRVDELGMAVDIVRIELHDLEQLYEALSTATRDPSTLAEEFQSKVNV